jgi:excisionase family DNA binding protein
MGSGTSPEPLAVKPREAWRMLGCGNTYGYQLLNAGQLASYRDGRSRKITVASIRAYIARKLAVADATGAAMQAETRRRRGRPRKSHAAVAP